MKGNDIIRSVQVADIEIGSGRPFAVIAGPCQIEGQDHALRVAEHLARICERSGRPLIYKSSFDKANRSSVSSPRGVGIDAGLRILEEVRKRIGCPVTTDIHDVGQVAAVADAVDLLQIPAFLCRQTDLLVAAARTGRAINIKKGQFLAPWDMARVAEKVSACDNHRILLCDRGTSFGYNTLVSDFRSLPIMAQTGYPVVFDATHSVQSPGGNGATSGGDRRFVAPLARAAVAVGCQAIFIEAHETPDTAPSDGPNMLQLDALEELLEQLGRIEHAAQGASAPTDAAGITGPKT